MRPSRKNRSAVQAWVSSRSRAGLGVFKKLSRRHVFDHALAEWVDVIVGHRENSCMAWG
jgi:hypothetical protein